MVGDPLFTRCIECFSFSEFFIEFYHTVEAFVVGLTHNHQITFPFFGYEYGLVFAMAKL